MWFDEAIFYQIYPLGLVGAPEENDGITVSRIRRVIDWIPHLKMLGVGAVYFSPVFSSDKHGYDTRDYRQIDCRLGTNEDFGAVCDALHAEGIRVVLDGVFNHVGRGFWAFRDVLSKREDSAYRDWFDVRFDADNRFGDRLSYACWEGHDTLVRLNLRNPEVVAYLFESVRGWISDFGIDGLRLDVAYCLDLDFLRALRQSSELWKTDFLLLGEIVHGDYSLRVNAEFLHSCTNYECRKGLYSSFNDGNLFEIAYSLNRLFGDGQGICRGLPLLSFADNHDVTRLASILSDPRHLPLIYAMMYAMPGVPCVYYGSEWGARGLKTAGTDAPLRPAFTLPLENDLTRTLARLAASRRTLPFLSRGGYRNLVVASKQLVFERYGAGGGFPEAGHGEELGAGGGRLIAAFNSDERETVVRIPHSVGTYRDILSGTAVPIHEDGSLRLPGMCAMWLLPE